MTLDEYKKLNKERIEQGERELAAEEIRCSCGKLLCKLSKSGRILVWCKECRKEVELEIEIEQPKTKCWLCGGTGKLPTGFHGIGSCSNADIIADKFPEPCHICKGKGYI